MLQSTAWRLQELSMMNLPLCKKFNSIIIKIFRYIMGIFQKWLNLFFMNEYFWIPVQSYGNLNQSQLINWQDK